MTPQNHAPPGIATPTQISENYRFRFFGLERLYGPGSLEKLVSAHVCVIGLGGVGSWSVEALARSGVGHLTLVDYDEVCLSNSNRQIPALTSTVGKMKAEVLAARALDINPELKVKIPPCRFDPDSIESILAPAGSPPQYSVVIDATDSYRNKMLLISECWKRGQPIVTVGASGGRRDTRLITVRDFNITERDNMLFSIRKRLRDEYGFPTRDELVGIPCVFSTEFPWVPDESGELEQIPRIGGKKPLDCATGLGAASHVTGTFGFLAAQQVIERIVYGKFLS